MKCPNCNANVQGKFCEFCGGAVNVGGAETSPQNPAPGLGGGLASQQNLAPKTGGTLGFDLAGLFAAVNSALEVQKNYNETGQLSQRDMEKMNSGFGFGTILNDIENRNAQLGAQVNAQKEKNRRARQAILNLKCPECSAPFKKRETACKQCGAMLEIALYED